MLVNMDAAWGIFTDGHTQGPNHPVLSCQHSSRLIPEREQKAGSSAQSVNKREGVTWQSHWKVLVGEETEPSPARTQPVQLLQKPAPSGCLSLPAAMPTSCASGLMSRFTFIATWTPDS